MHHQGPYMALRQGIFIIICPYQILEVELKAILDGILLARLDILAIQVEADLTMAIYCITKMRTMDNTKHSQTDQRPHHLRWRCHFPQYREETKLQAHLLHKVEINITIRSIDHLTYFDRVEHLCRLTNMNCQALEVYRIVLICIYFLCLITFLLCFDICCYVACRRLDKARSFYLQWSVL